MLIFFDIDGTLITTSGVGIRAMLDAGRDLHGAAFRVEGVPFAGRLDPLIIRDLLSLNGVPLGEPRETAFRDAYRRRLTEYLVPGIGKALPGVMPLLDALEAEPGATNALLTGNFADTGTMKLAACGIDAARFSIQVWGDHSPHDPPARDHLPGVGLGRYRELQGRDLDPAHAVVIGDTPHDVACAKAHGCRSIGVATGQFSPDQLRASGADLAVPTLADTGALVRWIMSPAATAPRAASMR